MADDRPLYLFNPASKDLLDALVRAAMGPDDPDACAQEALDALVGGADPTPNPAFQYRPLQLATMAMQRSEHHLQALSPLALQLLPDSSEHDRQRLLNSLPLMQPAARTRALARALHAGGMQVNDEAASRIEAEVGRHKDRKLAASIGALGALGWVPSHSHPCCLLMEQLIAHGHEASVDAYVKLYEQHDRSLPARIGDNSLMGLIAQQIGLSKSTARKKRATFQTIGERLLHSGLVPRDAGDPQDWTHVAARWMLAAHAEGEARRFKRTTSHAPSDRPRPRF